MSNKATKLKHTINYKYVRYDSTVWAYLEVYADSILDVKVDAMCDIMSHLISRNWLLGVTLIEVESVVVCK